MKQLKLLLPDAFSELDIDREFVASAKKSRILMNFLKLKKFVKIRTKIR